MTKFNERLKEAMSLRAISQSELCERTGIPKSAMSQYVSGAFVPKQERTYQLAKALRVNESWLLGYDDVPMDRNDEKSSIEEDDTDETLVILNRGEKKLSPENRKKLLEMARLMFKEAFDEENS